MVSYAQCVYVDIEGGIWLNGAGEAQIWPNIRWGRTQICTQVNSSHQF